jgi:tRNA(Ile)-lysidine synthase
MLEKVEAYCQNHNLFNPGDTLVVACSGGPDSLALLDVLVKLRETYLLQLIVCYVHHGIRRAADDEVEFVRKAATDRQCLFVWDRVDVPALAKERHESEETTARVERYRILRQVAAEHDATAIAVAHHRNDQAETVLQHVLRGSGLAGLAAMRPRSGDIIRPFLSVTRREIEEYIQAQGLLPCDDETNHSVEYTRNRIRLELLPELTKYNPNIIENLNRLAEIAQGDEDCLMKSAQELFEYFAHCDDGGYSISKKDLLFLPVAMQRRLIRLMFTAVSQEEGNVPYHYTEQIREIADKDTGRQFRSKKVWVYTTYTHVCFIPAGGPIPTEAEHDDTVVAVTGPGEYQLGPYTLSLTLAQERPQKLAGNACILDYDLCPTFMLLRYRRSGDSIRLGPRMGKTLKKYFIDEKVPLAQRDRIPLLCHNDDVVWICGRMCGFEASVRPGTRIYMICTITGGDFNA